MNRGFIALTTVLTVSGILFALIAASSLQSATFFDQVLRKEYRFINYYNAGNCIDQAILEIAHDYFFTTSTERSIEHFNCSIVSVISVGNLRIITTRGDYMNAFVYRNATIRLTFDEIEVIKIE